MHKCALLRDVTEYVFTDDVTRTHKFLRDVTVDAPIPRGHRFYTRSMILNTTKTAWVRIDFWFRGLLYSKYQDLNSNRSRLCACFLAWLCGFSGFVCLKHTRVEFTSAPSPGVGIVCVILICCGKVNCSHVHKILKRLFSKSLGPVATSD